MAKLNDLKQKKTKVKDREATEERLLLAAEHVFAKFGFKGATTRMIAKKADINLALINRYFDGKYGLLLKVIEVKHNQMHAVLLPYPPKETLKEECQAFAEHRLNICLKDLDFFRIVIAQFLTDQKFLKRFQETLLLLKTYTDFENRLNGFIKNKKIKNDVEIKTVYEAIETYIFGLIIGSIVKDLSDKEIKESLENFIAVYVQGLEP